MPIAKLQRVLQSSSVKVVMSTALYCAAIVAGFMVLSVPAPKPATTSNATAAHAAMPAASTQQDEAPPIPPPQGRDHQPPPNVITASDTSRYRAIFAAQQEGNWAEADRQAKNLDDKLLMGHVLAERYLSKDYKPSYAELHHWLEAYDDHPEAGDIYRLAVARRKPADARLPEIERHNALIGYGDDNGLSASAQDVRWTEGLAAWQAGSIRRAADSFIKLSDAAGSENSTISPWQASAASFWAYRALSKEGKHAEAHRYLARAAAYPHTFYGVLARKIRGESLRAGASALPGLTSDAVEALYAYPAIKRAVALTQVDEDTLAENELRSFFPQADKNMRIWLVSLASAMDLPAVQISMASVLKSSGLIFDVALYPAPSWAPAKGFAVDPSLVFAFARQESGFRASAHSRDGGMGLMQLMPSTARSMQNLTSPSTQKLSAENIFEPSANLALGQSYIAYLLQSQQVNGNLIYLAAAYNAGPAKVAEWQKAIRHGDDPLLFLERIPYSLTRNYVSQVLASYWAYQEIDGRRIESAIALSRGQWPRYDDTGSSATAVASADAADRG